MTDQTSYLFETVPVSQFPLIKKFYSDANYHNKTGRTDEIYCLRDTDLQNKLIAAVRLVKSSEFLILRSMVVTPSLQNQGIGRLFLQHIKTALKDRECWCFPFEGLEDFYAAINFQIIIPEKAPELIHTKYLQYRQQGRKISIMRYR